MPQSLNASGKICLSQTLTLLVFFWRVKENLWNGFRNRRGDEGFDGRDHCDVIGCGAAHGGKGEEDFIQKKLNRVGRRIFVLKYGETMTLWMIDEK